MNHLASVPIGPALPFVFFRVHSRRARMKSEQLFVQNGWRTWNNSPGGRTTWRSSVQTAPLLRGIGPLEVRF